LTLPKRCLTFSITEKQYKGYEGDTLASALLGPIVSTFVVEAYKTYSRTSRALLLRVRKT